MVNYKPLIRKSAGQLFSKPNLILKDNRSKLNPYFPNNPIPFLKTGFNMVSLCFSPCNNMPKSFHNENF